MEPTVNPSSIHPLIAQRRSIRAFSNRTVDDESFISLFEAARWASSSRNEQPWRFIAARKEDRNNFEKILDCVNDSNKIWAQHGALLIVVLAKKSFSQHQSLNSHSKHDVGLAIGNLALQATSLGIFLHQLGGIHYEKVREVFDVPDDFEVISIIVGGYPGDRNSLPEKLRERETHPRLRKELKEFVFEGKFGMENPIFSKHSG